MRSERLRVSLVKLQLVEGELGREGEAGKKMEVYETVLMECQDAMQTVKDEISTETVRLLIKGSADKGVVCSVRVDPTSVQWNLSFLVHCRALGAIEVKEVEKLYKLSFVYMNVFGK